MTTNVEIAEMPVWAQDGTAMVHVSVNGALTAARYAFLEDGLRKLIAKHGSIRVLLVLDGLEGMTAAARRKDKQFEKTHLAEIDRVAVTCATVEDQDVASSAIPFTDVNTRFFPPGEMEQATEWLRAGRSARGRRSSGSD